MYRLTKVKFLKHCRFFDDFKWDENIQPFSRYNLLYGWNGSGKTTLCDFFKTFEDQTITTLDYEFRLDFKDDTTESTEHITHQKPTAIPYVFRVFHQNYIQENIAVDTVKHIFTVGKKQAEQIHQLNTLVADHKRSKEKAISLDNAYKKVCDSFEYLKTKNARVIREFTGQSTSYNKNRFYQAYQQFTTPHILSQEELSKLHRAVLSDPLPELTGFTTTFIQPTVKDYILDVLNQTPVNKTIKMLQNNSRLNQWVEEGLDIHENEHYSTCVFCGAVISNDRFEELRAHFNQSYKELSDKIDKAINLLLERKIHFDSVKSTLPNEVALYPEFREQYRLLKEQAINLCTTYSSAIQSIIKLLQKKKQNMISEEYAVSFESIVAELEFEYSVFDAVLDIIKLHNAKSKDFTASIQDARKRIEHHFISSMLEEMQSYEEEIKAAKESLDAEVRHQKQCENEIRTLENDIKDSQIPANSMNRDISFIMGRSELTFENTSRGYKITRNGRVAKHLSKGEENAIALIYFFNTFMDMAADAKNTIVVLDDPISSFDSNFYYNAISYIREKTENMGQVFIFTHKFSLFKDYSLMYKHNTNRYVISRNGNVPCIKDEDKLLSNYHDEYAYLFSKIYHFVKTPPTDTAEYLPYPNMARRLLEGFLTFKLPHPEKMSLMDKVNELEGGNTTVASRAILRLTNNRSHLTVISDGETFDDIDNIAILPDLLNHLLEFIKYHDVKHYTVLATSCDSSYDCNQSEAVAIHRIPLRKIKLFSMPASAGFGNDADNSDYEEYSVQNDNCTYAIRISGDSMEPKIPDKSIVLVRQCEEVPNAKEAIVWYDGKSYCKKVVKKPDGSIVLVSNNKRYTPIPVIMDDFKVFGEVVQCISIK